MRWPLRTQILLPMAGLLLAALVGVSVLNAWLSWRTTKGQIEQQLRDVARTLTESRFPLTSSVLRQTRGLSGAEFAVTDAQGNLRAASRDDVASLPPSWQARRWDEISLGETVTIGGQQYFHAVAELRQMTEGDQPAWLHIFYPEERWRQVWWQSVVPPLIVGAAALVTAVLLAAAIAARVSRPIGRLQIQVDQIAQGDFRPMPAPARNDELRDLAGSINHMAQMLARYEDEVRRSERLKTLGQLGGGIAHQMRNAATGCRMALDLHRRQCPLEPGCENLDVATRQLVLMEKYLQRFLRLGTQSPQPATRVELAPLIDGVLSLVEPAARHVGVTVERLLAEEPLEVRGDSDGLEQLLINLLLNAIDAAASRDDRGINGAARASRPALVLVELARNEAGQAVLAVKDSGPGPPEEIRDRLFEPLVSAKHDGTGLGLSVARQIAEQHGGTIGWRREQDLTSFVVELPLLAAEAPSGQIARR